MKIGFWWMLEHNTKFLIVSKTTASCNRQPCPTVSFSIIEMHIEYLFYIDFTFKLGANFQYLLASRSFPFKTFCLILGSLPCQFLISLHFLLVFAFCICREHSPKISRQSISIYIWHLRNLERHYRLIYFESITVLIYTNK